MMDFVKKALALTIGIAALTTDKLKELADEAVERGEITGEEAKKFVEDVISHADREKQSIQSWIKEQVGKALIEAGAADSKKVAELEERIAKLESLMNPGEIATQESSADFESGSCD